MIKRYTLIGSSKTSLVFYDKKLKRAVTFDQIKLRASQKSKKWTMYKYIWKIKKYGVNKFISKLAIVVVPLLLLGILTFFRSTYTTFHLYLFLFMFTLFGVITPIVAYKYTHLCVKYFVSRTAKLTEVNDAFMSRLHFKSNFNEKITLKFWILNIIGPICSAWIATLICVYNFFNAVIHNEIVNYPINKISLIYYLGSGFLFGFSMFGLIAMNLIECTLLLKKHQRGEIETLPDVEVETIDNKEDSLVEKEVSGEVNEKQY